MKFAPFHGLYPRETLPKEEMHPQMLQETSYTQIHVGLRDHPPLIFLFSDVWKLVRIFPLPMQRRHDGYIQIILI